MSLRKKLISTFLILMLLIFLPLIYIIQTKIKPMNMNQVEMQTLELLTSKSNEVGSWLNQRISELKILNEFPGCKTLNFVELKPYLAEINKNFKENYGNIPDNFAIGGIDGIGWINENITIDVSERDYFKEAMTSNKPYVISTPVISKSHQNPIFLICYSILSNEGEKIGFINGAIDLDVISSITSNINIYDGFSWIMNRNTDIYTSSNSSFDKIDLNRDILDLIVNESSTTSTGIINLDKNLNRNDSVFYTSVPYANDWILCTLINNNKLYYQSNQIFNIISTVIIVLFVGYIITAIIISSSLAKPVEKLKLHMLKVSDGDLNLVYNTNTTIKEISDLGLFLNQMVYKIKNLINETHTAYELKRTAELRALQSQSL